MEFLIRNAQEKDWEAVVRIMDQVHRMHVEWRPDIYKPNENIIPKEAFEQLVEEETLFVAEADSIVVGMMEIIFRRVETPSHVTRNILFIDSMAVDEKYRGRGIGHLFFEKAKQVREEKGLDGIELQVNARNRAAYDMYTKYGFTEKSINMELL